MSKPAVTPLRFRKGDQSAFSIAYKDKDSGADYDISNWTSPLLSIYAYIGGPVLYSLALTKAGSTISGLASGVAYEALKSGTYPYEIDVTISGDALPSTIHVGDWRLEALGAPPIGGVASVTVQVGSTSITATVGAGEQAAESYAAQAAASATTATTKAAEASASAAAALASEQAASASETAAGDSEAAAAASEAAALASEQAAAASEAAALASETAAEGYAATANGLPASWTQTIGTDLVKLSDGNVRSVSLQGAAGNAVPILVGDADEQATELPAGSAATRFDVSQMGTIYAIAAQAAQTLNVTTFVRTDVLKIGNLGFTAVLTTPS